MFADTSSELIEDESRILQRFGGNRALFAQLIARFQPEAERHLLEIRQHLAVKDREGLTATLHSLKGVAANMGASALAATLATLEQRFKGDLTTVCAQILDTGALDALERLAKQSTLSLQALAGQPTTMAKPPTTERSVASYSEQLRSLKAMITIGDLRAVQTAEALLARRPQDHRLQAIVAQVQSLDFANAAQTLTELIQHGSHS